MSPGSLYLKEEWGDVTYWANDNGRFNLSCLSDMSSLLVMGQSQSEGGDCLSHTAPPATKKSKLAFNRPFSCKKGKTPSTATFGCKVIFAKKTGKSFDELNQTYVNVNENTANVEYITEKAREKWGQVVLVSGNGLPITDEEGTRGKKAYFKIKLLLAKII